MNRSLRVPGWVTTSILVVLAFGDGYLGELDPISSVCLALACVAIVVRLRWPLVAYAMTLPSVVAVNSIVAPMVALYAVARISRGKVAPGVCAFVFASVSTLGGIVLDGLWHLFGAALLVPFAYQLAPAAVAVLLGQLVQSRADLAARLVEIEETKAHERELYGQSLLARERTQLSREMHDVVSHQVSLIAVQAAALQVRAPNGEMKEGASAIRGLATGTLEELRSMVALLRVAGAGEPGLAPQPTLGDLSKLIAASGIDVEVSGGLPTQVGPAGERAVYRTVQEALTNVRKHAPGAQVRVRLWADATSYGDEVTNGPPTGAAVALPGSGTGLMGLRERAELLGGRLVAGSQGDGFSVSLRVPLA